jgi:hypothetical protein
MQSHGLHEPELDRSPGTTTKVPTGSQGTDATLFTNNRGTVDRHLMPPQGTQLLASRY